MTIELIEETEIRNHAGKIFDALGTVMRKYRQEPEQKRELAPMPDLQIQLVDTLHRFPIDREVRYKIYDILEQIQTPTKLYEEIVSEMDKEKDLDHPLAFKATTKLAQRLPDAPWLEVQKKRREAMLAQLTGSNQDVMDNFDTLIEESRGLVMAGDPRAIRTGKVGMEIEAELNKGSNPHIIHRSFMDPYVSEDEITTIRADRLGLNSRAWTVGVDEGNYEVRKNGNALAFDIDYLNDLIHVSQWFGDRGSQIKSLHIHFDRVAHPYKPDIGYLFEGDVAGRNSVYENDLGTWEIRGLNLPRTARSVHPARLADAIELYLSATSADATSHEEQLKVTPEKVYTNRELTLGHIATYIQDPQGRLAAIMALHDTMMLDNINPLAFVHSVRKEDLTEVMFQLRPFLKSEEDVFYANLVESYATDTQLDTLMFDLSYNDNFDTFLDVGDRVWANNADASHFIKNLSQSLPDQYQDNYSIGEVSED